MPLRASWRQPGASVPFMLLAVSSSRASPTIFYALGTAVIGITPGWLKDLAVERFGTHDKQILLASVFVVMALASAVVGVIASRRLRLGLLLAAALNLVALGGAVKTFNGPDFSAGTILPGLLSLVVSVVLLWLFARSWGAELTGNDAPTGFDRRTFLEVALASGGVAVIAGGTSTLFGKAGAASSEDVGSRCRDEGGPAAPGC